MHNRADFIIFISKIRKLVNQEYMYISHKDFLWKADAANGNKVHTMQKIYMSYFFSSATLIEASDISEV